MTQDMNKIMLQMNNVVLVFVTMLVALVGGCAAPGKIAPPSQSHSAKQQLTHNYCYQYLYGEYGTTSDYRRALQWCRRGANEGIASSQALLAELHFFGLGIPQDYYKAMYWYEQAAEQSHTHAQFMLHHMLSDGLGTLPDGSRAIQWLELSAASGHSQAQMLLETQGAR